MKTLILMRHSHAVSNNPAYSDHERPLTDEGRRLAESTAEHLSLERIGQIVCSSATRTVETAQIVSSVTECESHPTSTRDLYLAPATTYVTLATEAESTTDTLAMVGHNPGIASAICQLANQSLSIPPACVAIFRFAIDDWQALRSPNAVPELAGFISGGSRIR